MAVPKGERGAAGGTSMIDILMVQKGRGYAKAWIAGKRHRPLVWPWQHLQEVVGGGQHSRV